MKLSRDERSLLLAVSTASEEQWWERFEQTLGLTWDIATLAGAAEKPKPNAKPEPLQLSRKIRIPMLMAMAPEFFKHLSEDYREKFQTMQEAQRLSGSPSVVEIGTLSTEQAIALYRQIGSVVAGAKTPDES